jgi:hypothetical protein
MFVCLFSFLFVCLFVLIFSSLTRYIQGLIIKYHAIFEIFAVVQVRIPFFWDMTLRH